MYALYGNSEVYMEEHEMFDPAAFPYPRVFFNPAVFKAAKLVNSYRQTPDQVILPCDSMAFVSEDSVERRVIYYYTEPAHFQIIFMFYKHRGIWIANGMYSRRLRHDVAKKKLPAECSSTLEKRRQKRLCA